VNPGALVAGFAGALLAAAILWDAFETILVPRRIGRRFRLTRFFYLFSWRIWRAIAVRIATPARREAFLGFFGPLSLLLLLVCWAAGLLVAFALMQSAVAAVSAAPARGFLTQLYMSGETFFTLGFGDVTPGTAVGRLLSVLEAGTGFGFLGTVIGYLPTMYGAFAQREVEISLLDARAGSPPTAAEWLGRLPADGAVALSDEMLREWERWAAQLLETHISYPQLAYYRSQHLNQSWLAALTAILDSSALILAGMDGIPSRQAKLTFAMARHALVDITQIFVTLQIPCADDRMTPDTLRRLRARLAGGVAALPEDAAYAARLAVIRLKYEPYAHALAERLLVELPPWIHESPRRDNWQGGPWDRALSASTAAEHRTDEHF
jgi:hypothetical protein